MSCSIRGDGHKSDAVHVTQVDEQNLHIADIVVVWIARVLVIPRQESRPATIQHGLVPVLPPPPVTWRTGSHHPKRAVVRETRVGRNEPTQREPRHGGMGRISKCPKAPINFRL